MPSQEISMTSKPIPEPLPGSGASSIIQETVQILLQTDPQPTFDRFCLFPKLPIELRLAIWAIAIKDVGPRRVVLNINIKNPDYKTPPTLLSVNSECRQLALKSYVDVSLSPGFNIWLNAMGYAPKFCHCIDLSKDIVIIELNKFPDSATYYNLSTWLKDSKDIAGCITRIIFRGHWFDFGGAFSFNSASSKGIRSVGRELVGLEEVTLEVHQPYMPVDYLHFQRIKSIECYWREFFEGLPKEPKVEVSDLAHDLVAND
jgi:hypothetical protein